LLFDNEFNFGMEYKHNTSMVSDPYNTSFHKHDDLEVFIMISGNASYIVENNLYSLSSGDILILNGKERHRQILQQCSGYESIQLNFKESITDFINSPAFNPTCCFINRPLGVNNKKTLDESKLKEILDLCHKIERVKIYYPLGNEIFKLTYLIQILMHINIAYLEISKPGNNGSLPKSIQRALDIINGCYNADLSLESISHELKISRFNLSREFKRYTGYNLKEYIILKRIQNARRLIENGFSTSDACSMSGFNDYSNFMRLFKKVVCLTPSEYKKNYYKASRLGACEILDKQINLNISSSLKLPDLIVTDIAWTPEEPVEGNSVLFSATVKNIGKAPTQEGLIVGVGFNIRNSNEARSTVTWSDSCNEPLQPGQSITLTANSGNLGSHLWTAEKGEFTVIAVVDDMDRILESNNNNNSMEKPLVVGGR